MHVLMLAEWMIEKDLMTVNCVNIISNSMTMSMFMFYQFTLCNRESNKLCHTFTLLLTEIVTQPWVKCEIYQQHENGKINSNKNVNNDDLFMQNLTEFSPIYSNISSIALSYTSTNG